MILLSDETNLKAVSLTSNKKRKIMLMEKRSQTPVGSQPAKLGNGPECRENFKRYLFITTNYDGFAIIRGGK